ncbi:GTP cyclohydrolase FolE2 [Magnetococcales bacterium HHB-1]
MDAHQSTFSSHPLTDVQALEDHRNLPINKVGVKDIRYPIVVKDRAMGNQNTIASVNMYVNLPHQFKGTHMSRFLEVLSEYDRSISVESLPGLLKQIQKRLVADEAYIELTFPYFVKKTAPVSGAQALMDYRIRFVGEMRGRDYRMLLVVETPVTSLCPCSKQISKAGAHNQRSKVTVELRFREFVWIEEVIEVVERNASCELYPILKRPDEKYVTERAYDNPRFVEDIVRDVAEELGRDSRITWFSVASENFESIHNHSAYAFIEGGQES